jgi:hypothetical protein
VKSLIKLNVSKLTNDNLFTGPAIIIDLSSGDILIKFEK